MSARICLYTEKKGELEKFLSKFYNATFHIHDDLKWEKMYQNPVELAEIIGTFIDNSDDYEINMWICLDKNVFFLLFLYLCWFVLVIYLLIIFFLFIYL